MEGDKADLPQPDTFSKTDQDSEKQGMFLFN